MYQFKETMQLTFKPPDDDQAVEKAVERFRANPEFMAFSGIKQLDKNGRRKGQHEFSAEVVAAICRAWLAATEEPPMKRIQLDWRG